MNSPTTKNRQILLASRPSGEPSEENFNPAKQRWFVPWLCLPNCWSVLDPEQFRMRESPSDPVLPFEHEHDDEHD